MKLTAARKRIEKVMTAKCPRKDGEQLTPWLFVASRKDKGALDLVYRVPAGYSILDLEKQVDALYAALGAPVVLEDRAGAVIVKVLETDFPDKIDYDPKFLELAANQDILIGFDRQGAPVVHSLRVPHLLIAGKSGYGKTDLIRWILLQLVAHNPPEAVEIWIVDLKGFSFMPFKGIPHITRIVRDLGGALSLLEDAVKTMERRSKEIWDSADRNKAKGYKRLYVLIDEAYMVAPKVTRDKERRLLAQKADEAAAKISGTGREAGVGLFYCTQRPDSDVINPLVKANMDCKLCFKTETESNSEIVLDRPDAAKLPHKKAGRVLYASDDLQELQVPYVGGDEEWDKILQPYKAKGEVLEDESKRGDIDAGEGNPLILNGSSGEVFFPEWQPVQEGERNPGQTGKGGVTRGQEEGNRQEQALASVLDWTKIFKHDEGTPSL